MKIQGVVSAVLFANENSGYHVLRLDNNLHAVGIIPSVSIGSEYEFIGDFENNAKHGKQFAFREMKLVPPNTEAKILAFLGGGLIPGVGMVTARKIVEKFGLKTMEILQSEPQKLAQVKGISPARAEIIGEKYLEVSEMQSVMVWLQRFEISLNLSLKIYQQYGKDTIETVSKNPYALIETIDGVGFVTADEMAKKLGIGYTGTFRVRAGVVHVLKVDAETDGNTYVTLPELIKKVCHLLRIKMEDLTPIFNKIIEELCLDRIVVPVDVDGVQGLQLVRLFNAEKAIAQKLLSLIQNTKQPDRVDDLIEHYQTLQGITFHETQKTAIRQAVTGGVTVITGGPGTGKTTIIKAILYINHANEYSTQMLAPTGRAAKRIEETTSESAMTIHRCLEKFSYEPRDSYIAKDMVIVDEVSMCDCLLMASLLRKILDGTKVVFIGDSDQLPSVGAGNVLADIIESGVVPTISLTQVYRTGEKATIAINAHRINHGELPYLDNQSTDFFYVRAESPEMIKNEILGLCLSRLPQYMGVDSSKIQVLAPLRQGVAGVNNLNKSLQEIINPPSESKVELLYGET
ncbi:MAG: AAA family ATPase, partial [Clostridia bacterium]|nr:AAA family ATPase [Clostridia bacterium]